MDKVAVYEAMRAEGKTYEEIAKACGCSYQNVCQTLARYNANRFRPLSEERCCWKGLRTWLNENKISLNELIRRKYGRNHTGYVYDRMCRQLRGERPIKKEDIDFFREIA